jgi:hypothetical protein
VQSGVRRVIAQTDLYGRKSLGLIASWNLVRFD